MEKELEAGCGQIKIDLSVEDYYYCRSMHKAPGLRRVLSVLKQTGAKIVRISGDKYFTIINYAA